MAASKSPRVHLLHIKDEIQALVPILSNCTRDQFLADYLLVRATERAFLIISEAVRALPDGLIDHQPQIDWAGIRAIGNILRHEYERVEPLILWTIADQEF